jgi:hypothetical protein
LGRRHRIKASQETVRLWMMQAKLGAGRESKSPTQMTGALGEPGITWMPARSPQAKAAWSKISEPPKIGW